jgi:hypothetical protein
MDISMHLTNIQKKTIITPWAAVQQTCQGAAQSAVEHTQLCVTQADVGRHLMHCLCFLAQLIQCS